MQCDCNSAVPAKLVGMVVKGKKVLKATNLNAAFTFGDAGTGLRTTCTFELELEGAKKPVKQEVLHSFCPFCGKPAKNEEPKKG